MEVMNYIQNQLQKAPCIVGYRVQKGDTLWKIAKKYFTSVESIRTINELRSDEINEGDMLLVVKAAI